MDSNALVNGHRPYYHAELIPVSFRWRLVQTRPLNPESSVIQLMVPIDSYEVLLQIHPTLLHPTFLWSDDTCQMRSDEDPNQSGGGRKGCRGVIGIIADVVCLLADSDEGR